MAKATPRNSSRATDSNSNNTTSEGVATELCSIAVRLNAVAAMLSGIKPVLNEIADREDLSEGAGGSLEVIASLSDYINCEISDIASRLKAGGTVKGGAA